jgi:large subunit ribosomal protein L25
MQLKAILRDVKKSPKYYLKNGFVPAVLYGKGIENVHLAVPKGEFEDVFNEAGETDIVDLIIEDDKKKHPVLIYDVQYHYINHQPIHIDFYQIRRDQKIKTHIPVEYIGESPAVKNFGGILVKNVNEIEVEALPQDLPHNIPVDVSKLETIDSKILIKDLMVSEKVKILAAPDTVVAAVVAPKEEEVVAAPSITEIKIETEEKKAERVQAEKQSDEKSE